MSPRIIIDGAAPDWATNMALQINRALATPTTVTVPSVLKTTLPPVTTPGQLVLVTNEAGGAVLAFSDGTNFRRVTDRAIVS